MSYRVARIVAEVKIPTDEPYDESLAEVRGEVVAGIEQTCFEYRMLGPDDPDYHAEPLPATAEDSIVLLTEGPHSPGYSRQVAAGIAEAVRVLNHASIGHADGFGSPADVETVVGSLVLAFERMPQLLGQLAAITRGHAAGGALRSDDDREAAGWAEWAATSLEDTPATAVMVPLQYAKRALAHLYLESGDDDEQ